MYTTYTSTGICSIYMWYTHILYYYLPIKKNKILPFPATYMDLEGIKSDKDKYCIISLISEILKIQQTSDYNKKEAESQI